MKYSAKQYARALLASTQDIKGEKLSVVLDNFIELLVKNNDLKLFPNIASEWHRLILEEKGVKSARLTTAHKINAVEENNIKQKLKDIVGSEVELVKDENPDLIGGFRATVDDLVIDASVRNTLQQLKNNLAK